MKCVKVTTTIKKGFYFGDPCYALDDKIYDILMKEMWKNNVKGDGNVGRIFVKNKLDILVDGTSYGDGHYSGWVESYGVDAGMLSVIPLEYCKPVSKLEGMGWVNEDYTGKITLETKDGSFYVYDADGTMIEHVRTGDDTDDWEDEWEDGEED